MIVVQQWQIPKHLSRQIVHIKDFNVVKIASAENLADPFTKTLLERPFNKHLFGIGLRDMTHPLGQMGDC